MKRRLFIITSLILMFTSCAPSYIPNTLNTPMLYQKGDYFIRANPNIELQGAYALTDHFGIMSNSMYSIFNEGDAHRLTELGLGYYTVFSDKIHLELYSGYGFGFGSGSGSLLFINEPITEEGRYSKLFIQPGLGFHSKFAEIYLGSRFSNISFSSFERNGLVVSPLPSALIWEPSLGFAFGFGGQGFFEDKKLSISFTFANNASADFDIQVFTLNLGVIIRNRNYDKPFLE